MIACLWLFIPLIGNTGVEDGFDSLGNKPGNVAVDDLCRITLGFAGNGLNAKLVNLSGGLGGQHNAEPQIPEKHGPERIIFIHI